MKQPEKEYACNKTAKSVRSVTESHKKITATVLILELKEEGTESVC